jgi:nitric-oxide synthase
MLQLQGNCYGCGIILQTRDPQLAGFVEPQKYETKKKHRQLDQLLCTRYAALSRAAQESSLCGMWFWPCQRLLEA